MNNNKQSLNDHSEETRASKDIVALDAWINQHLEQREQRLTAGGSPFVWHQASINDLQPSSQLVSVVDLDQPLEYKK